MDPARFHRIQGLFEAALKRAPSERAAWVRQQSDADGELADEVVALLDAEARGETQLRAGIAERAHEALAATPFACPERIADYEVLGRIGSGGMGSVYRARQSKPKREVAVKVLDVALDDPRAVQRFEREAELLGRLRHPGIAQIHEAGTATVRGQRVPFLALELVEGETLDVWSSRAAVGVEERIQVVIAIARAVQAAHQQGVIHRDLKPSNVMIDARGAPKVLDFGIARALDERAGASHRTEAGEVLGTLAYMSPEQAEGRSADVDTRTDIYALGVVAFELLTGRLPVEVRGLALPAAWRLLASSDASAEIARCRDLPDDLRHVLAKAAEHDRTRRYGSAEELARDLERYLSHHPVSARAPTTMYQLAKFARRHRSLVSGVAATLCALLLGAVGVARMAMLEARARDDADANALSAQLRAANAEAIESFLVRLFLAATPDRAQGEPVLARDLLDSGAKRIELEFAGEPVVRARLLETMAIACLSLGEIARATELAEQAQLSRALSQDASPGTHRSAELLATALAERGDHGDSLVLYDLALERVSDWRARGLASDADVAHVLGNRAAARVHAGLVDEARSDLDRLLGLVGDQPAGRHRASELEALWLRAVGRNTEAYALATRHAAELSKAPDTALSSLQSVWFRCGISAYELGKHDEALSWSLASAELAMVLWGQASPRITQPCAHVAMALMSLGRFDQALAWCELALQPQSTGTRWDETNSAFVRLVRGETLRRMERLAEAVYELQLADAAHTRLGARTPNALMNHGQLALALQTVGDARCAEPYYVEYFEERRIQGTLESTVDDMVGYGACLLDLGQGARAEPILRRVLEDRRARLDPSHWRLASSEALVARSLALQGRHAEAEPILLACQERLERALGARSVRVVIGLDHLAELYESWGRPDEARVWRERHRERSSR
ncbi:MAG: protein kinase [Planctomycetes bacterium]|nr:protein kinase [Planctomycetota bacterium]